jgi:hypothetical protein
VELAPEKAASTAANAATYFDGMLSQSLMIGSPPHSRRAFATRFSDRILIEPRDYAFGGGGSRSGD